MTCFVSGALKGETCRVQLDKIGRTCAWGHTVKVEVPSPARLESECPYYVNCGGCATRHMTYGEELEFKRQKVEDCLRRIGGCDTPVSVIYGADNTQRYRNKAQFPISGSAIGFYVNRSHQVTDVEDCLLQPLPAARLRGGESCQLVLLDWEDFGLPGARALRAALPDTVPLLLLAEFDAAGMEEALCLGRTDALTKPFLGSALRVKIEELWNEKTPEPEALWDLKGMRFLAAEDNEINAEILTELLEMEGASCEIVANGQLAVERFQRSEPGEFDAILMDVQMPVMNGHEAARAIRRLEREDARRIPIIAMTANAFAEDEKAALSAGMDAHVPKPLNMEQLKKVIGQLSKGEGSP